MPVIGIDLAGKEKNDTGICVYFLKELDEKPGTITFRVHTDEEILASVEKHRPEIIAIDAPLSFPKPEEGYFRRSDRLLMERGFSVLSPNFKGMVVLVRRAIKLKNRLEEMGYRVIETYPRAVQEIFALKKPKNKNKDEFDAFLCALAAKAYVLNRYEDLSGIILPK